MKIPNQKMLKQKMFKFSAILLSCIIIIWMIEIFGALGTKYQKSYNGMTDTISKDCVMEKEPEYQTELTPFSHYCAEGSVITYTGVYRFASDDIWNFGRIIGWAQVQTADGTTGWVSMTYLSDPPKPNFVLPKIVSVVLIVFMLIAWVGLYIIQTTKSR